MILILRFLSKVILALLTACSSLNAAQKEFVVIICSYNNERWIESNLNSLFLQTYQRYRVIYIDDCSTDGTQKKVTAYLDKNKLHDKCVYIRNAQRQHKLHNIYWAIHTLCKNHEIVVELDGDDCFYSNRVLEKLNTIYSTTETWLTYGGFIMWPKQYPHLQTRAIPESVVTAHEFRTFHRTGYIFMALRSFYAWLFKKISEDDLKIKGKFFTCGSDIATMIPMFEMAGSRFFHITDPVYLYNTQTGINDFRTQPSGQKEVSLLIIKKPPYLLIIEPPLLDEQKQNLYEKP